MNRYDGSNLTPVVQTTSGPVQGYINTAKANVHTFLGIPFAEPPIGPLRFKPPHPIEKPRQATIFATFHAKVSLQLPMPFDTLMSAELLPQSEDCLYLNVWTLGVNDGAKRPVMVWIHSGACLSGSGSQRFWNGTNLAKNDVVVITLNYRLGVLGWMHLADLCGEEFNDTANLGMLDQIAALEWVRDNVEQFGGDPNNVTLFGASVGAACALTLLRSPPAKGLFHRVIAQSPPLFMLNPREWANFKAEVFLRSLGLTRETSHELFTIDPKRLLDVQTLFLSWPNFLEALAPIGPSEDGRTIPFTPLRDMMHENTQLFPDVEVMIGWTRDEYNLFFPLMQDFGKRDREIIIRTHFTHVFGKNAEAAFEVYRDKICPPGSPASECARYLASDMMCRVGSIALAENLARHGRKVYVYEWDYESSGSQGMIKAAHMMDAVFSWDNLEYWAGNPFLGAGNPEERDKLSKQISQAFVAFARTGDPNHAGVPKWPVYELGRRQAMVWNREVTVIGDVYNKGRKAWEEKLQGLVVTPVFQIVGKEKEVKGKGKEVVGVGRKRKLSREETEEI